MIDSFHPNHLVNVKLVEFLVLTHLCCIRFFFPDSPANARFLSEEDKRLAVLRIKQNQTGVENKHFKWDQYVIQEQQMKLKLTW